MKFGFGDRAAVKHRLSSADRHNTDKTCDLMIVNLDKASGRIIRFTT
ncbi:hypothetical protein ACWX0K_13050 [Nitrobacteraceae bacterium UC4446_H13]